MIPQQKQYMTQITYPTELFYLKKIDLGPRNDSTEDPLSDKPPVTLADSTVQVLQMEMSVVRCEVLSFDDVLNMKTLPGFVRYLPEELDTFVKEHLTKECL